ncbi:S41 family peptidase [Chryseobacterium pennipullorum]|uniref:S41 family peptidase n=1 Tax=Chryseobacterium pennipullorum TaxID=2258963 RepID=UPI001E439C3E|nr:S41 family peptidase [Chryseobacterium pennipullorum]
MKNLKAVLISSLLTLTTTVYAQNCNCNQNFEWIKKTFEENDAGFASALKQKGSQAYEAQNKTISEKTKLAKTFNECGPVLYEWLSFFRSGHIAIRPIKKNQPPSTNPAAVAASENRFSNWETLSIETQNFRKYLEKKKTSDYEGIWKSDPYTIGIKKTGDQYTGFIIESGSDTWTKGQVKLKFSFSEGKAQSVYYMGDHSAVESEEVRLIGKNHLQIGDFEFSKIYPEVVDEAKYTQYFKSVNSNVPYTEKLNETTLYFRIPSFQASQKPKIDSVIAANKGKILATENLIIDIRNGTGGSDASYSEILPFYIPTRSEP